VFSIQQKKSKLNDAILHLLLVFFDAPLVEPLTLFFRIVSSFVGRAHGHAGISRSVSTWRRCRK